MRWTTALLCSALIMACSDGNAGTLNPPPSGPITLTLSSQTVMASAGETRAVAAVVRDAGGSILPSPQLTWKSSAPAVATVSGSGAAVTVTAVDDGTATITASSGSSEASVVVSVHRTVASISVIAASSVLLVGESTQLTAAALDARDHPIAAATDFTWASGNTDLLLVSETGVVTSLFDFTPTPVTVVRASLARDGVIVSGTIPIVVTAPAVFDHAALLLSDFEQPKVPTPGRGIAYFSRTAAGLQYRLTWSALSGPATEAHIHGPGGATEVADVLVDLGAAAQSTNHGVLSGTISAAQILPRNGQPPISIDSLATLMTNGRAYLDVHTAAWVGGEIRGQVTGPLPTEPGVGTGGLVAPRVAH
jgi:CHRD domain/Bacterial Ig-like domain (group 2)